MIDQPNDTAHDGIDEAADGAAAVPGGGMADPGEDALLRRPELHHWRERTITAPGFDDRGSVFFAAIEMTRMPMILTDANMDDHPIVFANKAFLDLTGYEESEILGRNCRFLQGARSDRATVAELREAIAAKQSIAVELLNYRRDGTPFWNAVFIGPVYDTSGKLLYYFGSQLDVTRRKNGEHAYRQAQKMESIGQLTAGLAHDFNNLLQVVNGNLELLAAKTEDARALRYVENARTAAERGAKLTRQLLAFARKTRLEPRAVDLTALVHGFNEVILSSLDGQADLRLKLDQDLPQTVIDPDQFRMALLNVVNNARDASGPGQAITIATRLATLAGDACGRDLSPGDYVVLEVIDEGSGMPPEVAERATEPFFSTKGVGKGTGLGLAMATGFVRQSRGRLEVDSEFGRGTAVRMFFPIAQGDEAPVEAPEPIEQAAIADTGGSEHILIVEDSAEVLDLACEILTGAGYRVTTAIDGEDGLGTFERLHGADRFDLLFTDLVMPGGMNGLALADAIMARDETVSVLLTTGYNEELVVSGPQRRVADVLSKPYRRTDLLDRVRQALNRRGSGGTRRRASDFGAAEE